jgi:hypothetical protein
MLFVIKYGERTQNAFSIVESTRCSFLYSVYYELTASTRFKRYLLIFRRRYTNNNWCIARVLCLLAANRVEVPLQPTLAAASRHNKQKVYQLLSIQRLLKMSK